MHKVIARHRRGPALRPMHPLSFIAIMPAEPSHNLFKFAHAYLSKAAAWHDQAFVP